MNNADTTYAALVDIRKHASLQNIKTVCQLLADCDWEEASPELENKKYFGWRSPKDNTQVHPEHRLEKRLLDEVRTVALPGGRGGLSTVTFVVAAFPVGGGKRGQIDLLSISNTGETVVVELKHGSNDPWWAVVEAAEYLLRLRKNYPRVKDWMKTKCGLIIGGPQFSRGVAVLPMGLFHKMPEKCRLARALAKAMRKELNLDIELREMDYKGFDRGRLPQIHRLTIWKTANG